MRKSGEKKEGEVTPPKSKKESAGAAPKGHQSADKTPLEKGAFVNNEKILEQVGFANYLDKKSLGYFSQASKATERISAKTRLLTAVVEGNEDAARKIITSHPELLLDSTAVVKDFSGKEIKGLTPFQAAICAWDVDKNGGMAQMMIEVLQQKQREETLSFDPGLEMQRQFAAICPDGRDAEDKKQKDTAKLFKDSTLNDLLTTINAATAEQVEFELKYPGQNIPNNPLYKSLNAALRNFRVQFSTRANNEKIFNPFYLLNAFKLYEAHNFTGIGSWNKRDLFWRQVIGYIQRHLPACYLQVFARLDVYDEHGDKLKFKLERSFKFKRGKVDMRPNRLGDEDFVLGYHYAAMLTVPGELRRYTGDEGGGWRLYQKLLQTKKSDLENLFPDSGQRRLPRHDA